MKVQSVFDMTNEEFLLHIEHRHPHLRFTARGEHEALHRLLHDLKHHHLARVDKKSGDQVSSKRMQ